MKRTYCGRRLSPPHPEAYTGDAIAGKALNDAERKMTQNLSRRLLAIVDELLSPPAKPNR